MELIKIGVCLDDVRFAHALSIGLARSCRNMTFSLIEDLDGIDDYDLVLSSDESENPKVVEMVRDENEVNIYEEPPFRVYRYKESQYLVNDLIFIYFSLSGKNLEYIGDSKCKILAFGSVSGGCGCTLTALYVGQMLNKLYGCKCLYLNLCPIDDSKKYLSADSADSLLHLLYYLEVQKDFPLNSFIMQNGSIDYIHTNLVNSYFDELSLTLLQRLLKKIDEIGMYSFLLVDMSSHLSRNNKRLLAQAFRTIILYQERDLASPAYFSRIVDELKGIAPQDTLLMVKNFTETYAEEESALCLSKSADSMLLRHDGTIDLQSFSQMQNEAGAIAKWIVEETEYD